MSIFSKLFGSSKNQIQTSKIKDFKVSEDLFDEDKFWEIIQNSKRKANNDYQKQQLELENELRKLSPDEIILFGNRFRFFRGRAYSWELWGAIYLIHGGCGDDSFNDFREWVIGQGKIFYYKTIENPETLVEVETEKIEDIDWEGLGYVPASVFKDMTGQDMPYPFKENFETTGEEWEEESDDLKNMFPKLYEKYPDNI